jgi:transcriptional regulator with XRE-family HTH domain
MGGYGQVGVTGAGGPALVDADEEAPGEGGVDLVTLGQRVRYLRRARGLTLAQLGARVGAAASALSLVENGRREPRLSLLRGVADALGVPLADLLRPDPPSRRAALEIALERAQRDARYAAMSLPVVRAGRRLPTDALEALVGLHEELARRASQQVATPEEARRANAELREEMRAHDNYYPDIERRAHEILAAVRREGGPLTQRVITDIAAYLGFTLHYVRDLPSSTRAVTDLTHHRVYLRYHDGGRGQDGTGGHDPRGILLRTLGDVALGHPEPRSYADFLRQRVQSNYFAAALMIPEHAAVAVLRRAKPARDLAIEDLRDMFAVSYETAAHRFTNLATHHLDIAVHFLRAHESGTIYKAYANDGVSFPTDVTGAIEGQRACRQWGARLVFAEDDDFVPRYQYTDMPSGTYWCTTQSEPTPAGRFSINVGVPFEQARWFRGRDTARRTTSTCPDPGCCRRPPADLAARWKGNARPSARAHAHLLAALPPGTFPGVDDTEVYTFLEHQTPRHAE